MTAVEGCDGSGDVLMMTVTSSSMELAVPFLIAVPCTRCVMRVKETARGAEKPDSDSELFEVAAKHGPSTTTTSPALALAYLAACNNPAAFIIPTTTSSDLRLISTLRSECATAISCAWCSLAM